MNGNTKFPQVKISDECLRKLKNGHGNETIIIAKIFRKVEKDLNTLAGITNIADIIFYEKFRKLEILLIFKQLVEKKLLIICRFIQRMIL